MGNDKTTFLPLSKKVKGRQIFYFSHVLYFIYTKLFRQTGLFMLQCSAHVVGSGAQQVCQGERGEGGDRERGPGGAVAAVSEALTHGLHVVVVGHEVAV